MLSNDSLSYWEFVLLKLLQLTMTGNLDLKFEIFQDVLQVVVVKVMNVGEGSFRI